MYTLKLGYKKFAGLSGERVKFEVLERGNSDELRYEKRGCYEECFILRDSYMVGRAWDEQLYRLEVAARACAFFNGRKNVCSISADEGVLY